MQGSHRLGEILVEDFGWREEVIQSALDRQRHGTQPSQRIGKLLRTLPGGARDVPLALLLQASSQRRAAQRSFDDIEYQELGLLYRHDIASMQRRITTYSGLMVTLVLYIAYPLNLILGQTETQAPPRGLLVLYCAIGLFLVVLSLVLGDYVMKAYGQHLKRRFRITRARAAIRASQIRAGRATVTPMPHRRPSATRRERPDPEITGVQTLLPILYSGWCIVKLGLATFFVACLWQGDFRLMTVSTYRGLACVLLLGPIWIQAVSSMCERFHKYVKEALAISVKQTFPNASTEHLRAANGGRWRRPEVWAYTFLGVLAIVFCVGSLLVGADQSWPIASTTFRPQPTFLVIAGAAMFAFFVFRVADVTRRIRQSELLPK